MLFWVIGIRLNKNYNNCIKLIIDIKIDCNQCCLAGPFDDFFFFMGFLRRFNTINQTG